MGSKCAWDRVGLYYMASSHMLSIPSTHDFDFGYFELLKFSFDKHLAAISVNKCFLDFT